MNLRLPLVFMGALSSAACTSGGRCGGSFRSMVVPTGIATYGTERVIVAANWYDCTSGRIGGAIHIVEIATGETRTVDVENARVEAIASSNTEVAILVSDELGAEYLSIDPTSPDSAPEAKPLPAFPVAVEGSAGFLYFALDNDTLLRRGTSGDSTISAIPAAGGSLLRRRCCSYRAFRFRPSVFRSSIR
jgi:hypothetical protein